jgi:hypothetical protein
MPRTQRRKSSGDYLLLGYEAIAGAFGVNRKTIYRWVMHHNFPLATLPDGHTVTSTGLIDLWLMQRLKAGKNGADSEDDADGAGAAPLGTYAPRRPRNRPMVAAALRLLEANPSLMAAVSQRSPDDPSPCEDVDGAGNDRTARCPGHAD